MAGLRAQFGILGPALRAGFLRGAPGALAVSPGRPPAAGSGSLDFVRRDLGGHGGHGCLLATRGDVLLRPRRRALDGPRGDVCDPGRPPGGDVTVPSRPDAGRGGNPAILFTATRLNRYSPGHGARRWDSVRFQRADYRLCVLRRGTVRLLRSSVLAPGARLHDGAGSFLAGHSDCAPTPAQGAAAQ